MYRENRVDLARYRMASAEECLADARDNLERERYATTANRSYYAIFNAMRAVLNLEGKDFKRHSGVIGEFRREYVKTGVFPPDFSDIIRRAFDIRNASDYQGFYVLSQEDVIQQTADAAVFVEAVRRYLDERTDDTARENPPEGV